MTAISISRSLLRCCRHLTVMQLQRNYAPLINNKTAQAGLRTSSVAFSGTDDSKIYHPSEQEEVPIPQPKMRTDESIEVKRSRLLYQSRKRGMLENGIILSTFAAKFLTVMKEPELTMYDKLINLPSNDWEIYYWAIGQKPVPAEYDTPVMTMLKKHAENEDKEVRLTQPDLY